MLKKFFEFFIKNSDKTIVSSKGNNNIVITNNSEVWVDGKKVKGIENEKLRETAKMFLHKVAILIA